MIQQFLSHLNQNQTHTIAVACAHDEDVLSAIIQAKDANIANAILVGNQVLIEKILNDLHSRHEFLIINEPNNELAVKTCIELIKQEKANMLMKGLVDTSVLLKQVVSTQDGLKASPVLAHVAVVKVSAIDRLLIMSDGAMNILPTLEQKIHILNHCVSVAKACQFNPIRVGVICAVEKVNPKMQCTLDAIELKSMNENGLIKDCIVDGPYALDNALSVEAAKHKGMTSAHAGLSNVLLLPNIESGNVLYKAVTYLAQGETAGVIMGASVPIVVTSRSDSDKNKLNSIALAALIAQNNSN
jgi:phosphate butyryltransferase